MRGKRFHVIVALLLVVCIVCPFAEYALHWNQTVLDLGGQDSESTVAVLACCIALVLFFATVATVPLSGVRLERLLSEIQRSCNCRPVFVAPAAGSSPRLNIRI
jgi:uncharacterized membrane protein